VQYFGYVISDNGIVENPEKVKAVKDFQVPANQKQLRSFLVYPPTTGGSLRSFPR